MAQFTKSNNTNTIHNILFPHTKPYDGERKLFFFIAITNNVNTTNYDAIDDPLQDRFMLSTNVKINLGRLKQAYQA